MKKLIQILGIVVLAIVVILNIVYTADMNSGEQISINFNSFIYIIGLIITAILIYFITEVINKHLYNGINEEKKRKLRKWMVAIAIVLYLIYIGVIKFSCSIDWIKALLAITTPLLLIVALTYLFRVLL